MIMAEKRGLSLISLIVTSVIMSCVRRHWQFSVLGRIMLGMVVVLAVYGTIKYALQYIRHRNVG